MGSQSDPYDLERFVIAQNPVYARVCAELRAGEKRSHWMWFVFPQLQGLGSSPMARKYAISSLDEARAYLAHPILGPRLKECTALVQAIEGRTLEQIFYEPDNFKFCSCMTLFAKAADDPSPFVSALEKYNQGRMDEKTLQLLEIVDGG
ncbi:MAG TPA: DUF1810 domain-containing protein [Steroidobacteraceae bacterium]